MCQADLDVDDQDNDGDESTPFTEEKQVQWCKRKQEVTSEVSVQSESANQVDTEADSMSASNFRRSSVS